MRRCVALIGQERRRYNAMRWFIARLICIDNKNKLMPVLIIEYCDNLVYLQYKKALCDLASIMFNIDGFNVVC
jgi:hypothetical protein